MNIKRYHIYDHADYGEVLVQGIMTHLDDYETDDDTGTERETDPTVVVYATDWDVYGAMPSASKVEPPAAFAGSVRHVREWDSPTYGGRETTGR